MLWNTVKAIGGQMEPKGMRTTSFRPMGHDAATVKGEVGAKMHAQLILILSTLCQKNCLPFFNSCKTLATTPTPLTADKFAFGYSQMMRGS